MLKVEYVYYLYRESCCFYFQDPLSVTQVFPLPTSSVSPDLKRKSNAQVSARSSDEVEYTTVKNINLKNVSRFAFVKTLEHARSVKKILS